MSLEPYRFSTICSFKSCVIKLAKSCLGVAQLVARYLGVVEAASSSLVTQTISSVHNRFQLWTLDIFLLMLTFGLNIELL